MLLAIKWSTAPLGPDYARKRTHKRTKAQAFERKRRLHVMQPATMSIVSLRQFPSERGSQQEFPGLPGSERPPGAAEEL